MRKFGYGVIGLAAMVLVAVSSTQAAANTLTFDITVDHCTGNCGPQNSFGTITLTDVATNEVSVDVTLLNGNKFINGGQPTFVFNLDGITSISISGLTTNFQLVSTTAGSNHFDGFGSFDFAINDIYGSGASQPLNGPLDFTVTAAGLSTASFMQLSSGGSPSAYFGVDILSGTTGKTGPVGVICGESHCRTTQAVPEPGSFLLLGSGLFAAAALVRRRARARSN